jgi:NAD(P)-dependent dehydrogenase (short-subunit alcohol dehydrogenase family)
MKTAIVTGAAGGLGQVFCSLLLSRGFHVYGLDLKEPGTRLEGMSFISTDITSIEAIEKARTLIAQETEGIDVLVNNAGIQHFDSLIEADMRMLRKAVDVNLVGAMLITRSFADMVLKARGRIIITSSEIGYHQAQPFHGLYSITKRALDAYADSLRRELGCLGIKVIKLQPGGLRTGLIGDSLRSYDEIINRTTHYRRPLERMRRFVVHNLERSVDPNAMSKVISKALFSSHPSGRYRFRNLLVLNALDVLGECGADLAFKVFLGKGVI